ncbi:CMGC family protein kinase [Tritrichomonas foetus]|uniref:non-specific serine/threonine protein kinase n=1 Tax=Tritrichomonas foetus TaxID=1144522 RepID=A0A1J4KZC9_9EUKA|nr:CMGC family protein kinase [Tritrichomonas foetus]|eukprot:OHT15044.1 CMGC family protein kinase [Tritrichomonas foetus]
MEIPIDPFDMRNAYIGEKFNPDHPNISRIYTNTNLELGCDHWNYRAWNPEFGDISRYSLCEQVGSGRYSEVFRALQDDEKEVAIKILKPVNPDRVRRELRILSLVKDGPSILNLLDIVIDGKYGIQAMVTDYHESMEWHDLFYNMKLDDIRWYIYRVLKALEFTHKKGIMHRDIKPVNILCKDPKKDLILADWGLAEFYHPLRMYSSCVGTRYYKSPELLLNYEYYDFSIDIWAVGVVLLEALSSEIHIFDGELHHLEQIDTIAKVVGGDKIVQWADKYRKSISKNTRARLLSIKGRPFSDLIRGARKSFRDPQALDLLSKLLEVDHKLRISAEEALDHPFFDSIRDSITDAEN